MQITVLHINVGAGTVYGLGFGVIVSLLPLVMWSIYGMRTSLYPIIFRFYHIQIHLLIDFAMRTS